MELPPPRCGDWSSANRHLTAGGTVEGIPRENCFRDYYLNVMKKNAKEKYGRLSVIGGPYRVTKNGERVSVWRCMCDCGKIGEYRKGTLTSGNTKSCGCYSREVSAKRNLTHGASMLQNKHNGAYRTWQAMRQRCNYASCPKWDRYGGRGIKIDPRWDDFEKFLDDMGDRPDGKQLDRINNDGDYTKENCRWVSCHENALNRSSNILVTVDGVQQKLYDLIEKSGLPYTVVYNRVTKLGWDAKRALTTKTRIFRK